MIVAPGTAEPRRDLLARILNEKPSYTLTDDTDLTITEASWSTILYMRTNPLIRVRLLKRQPSDKELGVENDSKMSEHGLQHAMLEESSSSENESHYSSPDLTGYSSPAYSSPAYSKSRNYVSSVASGTSTLTDVAEKLRKTYLKSGKTRNRPHKGPNVLDLEAIGSLESTLLRMTDESFDANNSILDDDNETEGQTETEAEEDAETSVGREQRAHRRHRRRSPQPSREKFCADEGFAFSPFSDMSGFPFIEIDQVKWPKADVRSRVVSSVPAVDIDYGFGTRTQRRPTGLAEECYVPSKRHVLNTVRDSELRKPRASNNAPTPALQEASRPAESARVTRGSAPANDLVGDTSGITRRARKKSIRGIQDFLTAKREGFQPFFQWPTGLKLRSTNGKALKSQLTNDFGTSLVLGDIENNIQSMKRTSSSPANFVSKVLYKRAHECVVEDVETTLAEVQGRTSQGLTSPADSLMREELRESQLALVDIAKRILGYFLPVAQSSTVIRKYWGAVQGIIKDAVPKSSIFFGFVANKTQDPIVDEELLQQLVDLLELMEEIHIGATTVEKRLQECYRIPRAMPIAFKALVFLMIFASASLHSPFSRWQTKAAYDECRTHLIESKIQLALLSRKGHYQQMNDYAPVYSESLLAMMLANLQEKISTEEEFLLTEVYNEHAINMVSSTCHCLSYVD